MTFQPAIPLSGFAGWRLLQRTEAAQREAFNADPQIQRDIAYFRAHAAEAKTAEDLVNDRRLLKVALGAYGLDEDIDKKAFIRKVLEEGTLDPESFANRLVDSRYRDLARDFGYGDFAARTSLSTFVEKVISRYQERQFEAAVGDVDNDMRLAMNFRREIGDVVSGDKSASTKWFAILGNTPLREVVTAALGLPNSFGSIDVDKQVEMLERKSSEILKIDDPSGLADPEVMENVIKRFFIKQSIENGSTTYNPALALITAGQSSFQSILNS
ncbi:DUF1217 domain-containing protein [Oceanicella actignis]|uniref:Flagellar protein n=1 Tax=Oceanicella actignis TaxID=1189325 RepID=A0A1M7SVT8_9RHOB|nr:DUF1217 domain-containing protein [Oceanicella actignis]TYO90609.1 uncharacterized protein DUF1217 [Oceanicella actignis]SES73037.1 Protein of unknown function [Oceanicella actignis]SHN62540.1 Protein of unknown function [Oceanicella actignis]